MQILQVAKMRRTIYKYRDELKNSPEYAEAFHGVIGSDLKRPPYSIAATQNGRFSTRSWSREASRYEDVATVKYVGNFDYYRACALFLLIQDCYPGVYEYPTNTVSEIRNGAGIHLIMKSGNLARDLYPKYPPLHPDSNTPKTFAEAALRMQDPETRFQDQVRRILSYMTTDRQAIESYSRVVFRHLEQTDFVLLVKQLVGEDLSHPPKILRSRPGSHALVSQRWDPMAEYYEMEPKGSQTCSDFYVLCAFVLYLQRQYPDVYDFSVERGMVSDKEPRITLSMKSRFFGKAVAPQGTESAAEPESLEGPETEPKRRLNEDLAVSLSTEIPKFCSDCGTRLNPGAGFCGGCGKKLN